MQLPGVGCGINFIITAQKNGITVLSEAFFLFPLYRISFYILLTDIQFSPLIAANREAYNLIPDKNDLFKRICSYLFIIAVLFFFPFLSIKMVEYSVTINSF